MNKTTLKIEITHNQPINHDQIINQISKAEINYTTILIKEIKTKKE